MRRSGCIALAVATVSLTLAFSRDTYPRAADLDAIHYGIRLEINDTGDQIGGETEILFALDADSVKSIPLDFAGLVADAVTENNRIAQFEQSDGKLNVRLQGDYHRGDQVSVAVKYHGQPRDGLFFRKNRFGDRTVFADNWPNRAHYWFPSIDHPYDKASVDFFVTAPARYGVVANGTLVETTDTSSGAKTTHWSEKVPIPTYCMVFGATDFSVVNAGSWNSIPVFYFVYPKDREHGIKEFRNALKMIEFYSGLIGPYPYEKLALVQSTTRFGGMENSSAIFFDEKIFDSSGKLQPLIAHEIAHQWFGDSITEADWHHVWLSESFATYFSAVYFERTDGRDALVKTMLEYKAIYLKQYARDPRPMYDPEITDLFRLLNPNNYQKGAWMLHMLRHLMGDERFFAGIRDYYEAFRDRNALTADFQSVMELRAGRPLGWFFREWFYEPGYPIYDVRWHWDAGTKELQLRVMQKQEKTLFVMPIDVEIRASPTPRHEVVDVRQREQVFTFKLDQKPRGVVIDPDEWVLKVMSVREEK